jgi:hypothetical protein
LLLARSLATLSFDHSKMLASNPKMLSRDTRLELIAADLHRCELKWFA